MQETHSEVTYSEVNQITNQKCHKGMEEEKNYSTCIDNLSNHNHIQSLFRVKVVYLQVLGGDAVILGLDLFEGGREVRKSEGHIDFRYSFINLSHQFINFL